MRTPEKDANRLAQGRVLNKGGGIAAEALYSFITFA